MAEDTCTLHQCVQLLVTMFGVLGFQTGVILTAQGTGCELDGLMDAAACA